MFSMCSELTPRARIPDTRLPQLMQPWRKIDFDYIEQICLKYKNKYRTMQGPKYAHRLSLSRASPLLMHDLLLLAVSITIQTTSTLPAYACLFVSFWHGVEKIWISNILFSFCKETFNSSLYV